MKKLIFFILFCLSFFAQASGILDILEQKESQFVLEKELKTDIGSLFSVSNQPASFIKAFENKNFIKAFEIWKASLSKTHFSKSSTGQALYAYLLFQNKFQVLALRHLLKYGNPRNIHPIVVNLWKKLFDKSYPIWEIFSFPIDQIWTDFFPAEILFKIGSKSPLNLKSKTDQDYIKFLLSLSLSKDVDVFSLEWAFVLSLIHKNDISVATKIISWLLSKTKDRYRLDKINLNVARLLADIGQEKAALEYYQKVKNISYFLLLAHEEMAWIMFNKGWYREAYSKTSIFLYDGFQKDMSSLMFLILSLTQLENCNYKAFSKTLSQFKALFSNKIRYITQILDSNNYDSLIKKLSIFYKSQISEYQLSSFLLSYLFKRDSFLKNQILLFDYIQGEKNRFQKKSLIQKENKILYQIKKRVKNRIQFLLKKEKQDILFALQNFHIAEAEFLYRIYMHRSSHISSFPKVVWKYQTSFLDLFYNQKDFFTFPLNPNELWLDELLQTEAGFVKGCFQKKYVF